MIKLFLVFFLILIILLFFINSKENFQNKIPIKDLVFNIQNKVNNIISNVFKNKKKILKIPQEIFDEDNQKFIK